MKINLLTLGVAGAIALTAAPSLKALPSPAASNTPPGTKSSRPLPFNGKIYAIDPAARTFSTQNKEKKIRVYSITPETTLTRKNSPARFEDLKIGDEVRGMAEPKGNGRYETASVIIGPAEEVKPTSSPSPSPVATPGTKSSPKPAKKSPTLAGKKTAN